MRTFHSTAIEVTTLQQKQQEQLVAMLRALEDGVAKKMKGETNVLSMSPYIKTIQDSLKIGVGPTHRDEDQIVDNKEQDNCVEETHDVDENDIVKSNLPCDEGKGENCHKPMIWQQLGNEIFFPSKMNVGKLEELVNQQIKLCKSRRRMSVEQDGCNIV